jgi:hypothetical protein
MKDKFLPYKLIRDVNYLMHAWFYFPFKGEKDGLPWYKPHWNFIQSVERSFGMLKGKLKEFIQKNKYSLCQMLNLVKIYKCESPIQMVLI